MRLLHSKLEFHSTRRSSEGVERSCRVLEIEHFGIVVIGRIHELEFGIVLEHMDLGFATVIADKCTGNAKPLVSLGVHGTNLDLAVFLNLLGAVLRLAGLNVELALENFDGTEGAYTRLVAVNCRQKVGATFLDEVLDFFHIDLLFGFYFLINFQHFIPKATENDLFDVFCGELINSPDCNLGSSLPGVAINTCRNSGEGNRLAAIFLSQIETALVARFQKFGFTMQAIPINRTRSVNNKLCGESETRSDFGLTRLATIQGNAGPQELRTCRPVNCPIDTATTQKRTVRRIHNGIDLQLGDITLDNFSLYHKNLHEKYT